MKSKSRILGIYLLLFAVILISAVTLRSMALINHLDEYGYFSDKIMISAANCILVFGILLFLSYPFLKRGPINLIPSFSSPANYVPSALVAVSLLFTAFSLISSIRNADNRLQAVIAALGLCFALLSTVYFIFNTVFIRTVSIRRANLGLCAIIFFFIYVTFIYFDNSLPINSHSKTVDQMAYLFTAVFFLYETRLSLGREKWKHYVVAGFSAALITAYSSIPSVILYFADGRLIANSFSEMMLTLTLFIFITSKLLLTSRLTKKETSPVVSALKTASEERSRAVKTLNVFDLPSENDENGTDENQITISDIETMTSENGAEQTDNETAQSESEETEN